MQKCTKIDLILKPSSEVYYDGSYLPNLNVSVRESLTSILAKVDALIQVTPGGTYNKVHSGTVTLVGDGINKVFSFPHNLGELPSGVLIVASSSTTSNNFTSTFTATQAIATFSIAPSPGQSLSFTYIAVKNQ